MSEEEKNIGILVGGGPAPGLNGVISSVTIEARRSGFRVFGIYDGYKWLAKGDEKLFERNIKELRIRDVSRIHFNGGSILRTSRTNLVKEKNGVSNAVRLLAKWGIRYLVTVGGDDTAYCAFEIARGSNGRIQIAHIPKTIDNDLPLPENMSTFGFQTARELGSILVKNLMEDSRITDRWYIVVTMGRITGHLALGIAKSAGATIAIIPEEFGREGYISFAHVCDILETAIIKRRAMGHRHGVLVIAEGIAERLHPDVLKGMPGVEVDYDPFGHMKLSDIELGKIIKGEIESRFSKRGEKMRLVEINIGYVLRCADPISIDQEYTRDLGFNAVHYLLSNRPEFSDSALIIVDNGKLRPMPFNELIDPVTKHTKIRFVDINSESYKVARSYMVRLEKMDFEDKEFLKKMAQEARMSVEQFVERYKYIIEKQQP